MPTPLARPSRPPSRPLSWLYRLYPIFQTLRAVATLPLAELRFHTAIDPDQMMAVYRHFTRPHPTYRLFGCKTLGAALLDLASHAGPEQYMASIGKRNLGGHFARRARARGYRFATIERNDFIDAIDEINHCLPVRQGRRMEESYRERTTYFIDHHNFRYYGVLDRDGKLMAYCEVAIYGNFAVLSRLLGYRNNDGIMHFMIVEIVSALMLDGTLRYVMYDTWFGASEGLRKFKAMLGFRPYRARYRLEHGKPARPAARDAYCLPH